MCGKSLRYVKVCTFRVTERQYNWLISKAKENECNIGEIIRRIITEAMKGDKR